MNEFFINSPIYDESLPFGIELAGISYCDASYKINVQNSDVARIEYIISGEGTIVTKEKIFHPKKGDTYILLPNEDHNYFSDAHNPWIKIWINISGSLINSLCETYSIQSSAVFHCNTQKYIEEIHNLLKEKDRSPQDIMFECSIVLHRLIQFLSIQNSFNYTDSIKIKEYIDKNVYSKITINDLSNLIFKSPSQTIRIFKKDFKITPCEYHLQKKIKTAISLIKNTNLSIKEISYKLGFTDEHYFSYIFKQKTNKKPTDYRKQIK